MSNPTFSQFQKNIQRQSHEQRAVGSLLSGMAIALMTIIVLVAILAAYGGWVLSRQIQQQSVTITEIDSKFTRDLKVLRKSLEDTVTVVDTLTAQNDAQKQKIEWLQNQLVDIRAQQKKDYAKAMASIQKLENRVYDLERIEAQRR